MNLVERTLAFLRQRKRAYQLTLGGESPAQRILLADLAKFCRASEGTMSGDPHRTSYLEGRRSVWLRIQQHLRLSDEQLMLLYGSPNFHIKEDDNG